MHPEIEREQAFVDRAYARLEEMRLRASEIASAAAAAGGGGTRANVIEREALVEGGLRRAAALDLGDESLVFGRIDRADGETFYIGRVAVADENYHALVVDWRAPIAEGFYRATPAESMGIVRRRHFICRGRRIVGIEDELLGPGVRPKDFVLIGEGALLDAMQRSRTGHMRDIVATIQAEQDAIIRAPLPGVLVVQGGPGTGKTAVALHRAAYLLYTHRVQLERSGVLVVGPNPVFLRYIERVLPSLGEHAVTLATAPDLAGVKATIEDTAAAARIKGSARMAKVLARAVEGFEISLREPVRFLYDGEVFDLAPEATDRIVEALRRRRQTHNARRRIFVRAVLEHLFGRYLAARHESRRPRVAKEEKLTFFEAMLSDRGLREALDRMWPVLRPREFMRKLCGSLPRLLAVMEPAQAELLFRPEHQGLSEADAALLDEASVLLGRVSASRRRPRREDVDEEERWVVERLLDDLEVVDPVVGAEREHIAERLMDQRRAVDDRPGPQRSNEYGYILVDEAQDVPPMRWRMLARRCRAGAMTVLGDLGQSAAESAPENWQRVVADVPKHRDARVVELSINYRTPAEIMDLAARVLSASSPGLRPPRSVRHTGQEPVIRRAAPGGLEQAVAKEAWRHAEGTTAIVTSRSLLDSVREWTGAPGFDEGGGVLDERVAVYTYDQVKGLEFDSVVVVEPAEIVEEAPGSLRALYVALTRPTQRLTVVHSLPLPGPLVRQRSVRGPSSRETA